MGHPLRLQSAIAERGLEYLIEVYRYVTGRNPIYATFRYTLVASQ